MPRKKQNLKGKRPEISQTALYYATDGLWGEMENPWEGRTYQYPTLERQCRPHCKAVWLTIKDEFMPAWVEAHPGRRCNFWWEFSAPPMNVSTIVAHGWDDCYFAERLYQPRE